MFKLPASHLPLPEVEQMEFYAYHIPADARIEQLALCTRLTHLKFNGSTRPPQKFLTEVLQHTRITKLTFGYFCVAQPQHADLIFHCRHLTFLDINLDPPLSSSVVVHATNLTNLESLKLSQAPAHLLTDVLPSLSRLTLLDVSDVTLSDEFISLLATRLSRLRTLRLDVRGENAHPLSGVIPGSNTTPHINPLIQKLSLTSLSLSARPLSSEHIAVLAESKTLRYLNLFACVCIASCEPLARNESLTWLSIRSPPGRWHDTDVFLKNSTLTALHLPEETPDAAAISAHIEENKIRIKQWIEYGTARMMPLNARRHDFFTSLLYIALVRRSPSSVWRTLPMDVVKFIFGFLQQTGKSERQIEAAVEYVFANSEEMWAQVRSSRHGIVLKERVRVDEKSTFKWEPRKLTPSAPTHSAPPSPSTAAHSKADREKDEKCSVQ